jgi:pantoate--beta-alanine ligase
MEIIRTVDAMQRRSEQLRTSGSTLALVPTMGYFHEGHLELMRVGKKRWHKLIVSIFVNPTQFGLGEDFESYPRDEKGDLAKADSVGVDIAFVPNRDEMYPSGSQTTIHVGELTTHLCGRSRPGHFDGVTTVVSKLFHITKPHAAIFGQKDYQQLAVVRRMVEDMKMDIEIVGVPIVREPDGLAMSSRNSYLNTHEKNAALCLKKSIDLAVTMAKDGEKSATRIKKAVEKLIRSHSDTVIDYVAICDPHTLEEIETLVGKTLIALAVKVGKTRLIDNGLLGELHLMNKDGAE